MQSGFSEKTWINLIGFQLAWWLAVLAGALAWPVLLFLIALHLLFHRQPLIEVQVIVVVALLGFSIDTLLMHAGIFIFTEGALLPPLWLFVLWLCFAATLRQGLKWFSDKPLISAIAGAIGGSLSYIGGAKLGAVELGQPFWLAACMLMLTWSLLFPLAFVLVNKLAANKVVEDAT